jgi:CHAT domain-containing protein/tetratricopeptide (TPR) repeat protein
MKKHCVLYFFALFSLSAFAQNKSFQAEAWDIDTLVARGKIKEAKLQLEAINKAYFTKEEYVQYLIYAQGFYFHETEDHLTTLAIATEALDLVPKVFPSDYALQGTTAANYLETLYMMSRNEESVAWQEQNLEKILLQNKYNNLITSKLYMQSGVALNGVGNFAKADDYLQKSLHLLVSELGENHFDVAKNYYRYAYTLYERNEFQKAITYYEKALPIFRQLKGEKYSYNANILSLIGESYAALKVADKALSYQLEAMALAQQILPEDADIMVYFYNAMAAAYTLNQQQEKAIPLFGKALAIDSTFDYAYTGLARAYTQQKNFEKAHQNLDKTWQIFKYTKGIDFAKIKSSRRFSAHLLQRANIYKAEFDATKNTDFLAKAVEIVEEAKRLSVYNINRFPEPRNKKRFYEDALSQIEKTLELDYQYFISDKTNLQHAFDYVEFGKGFLLHQAMEEQRFLAKAEVPQAIKTKEKKEKTAIEKLEKTIFEQGKNDALQNELFDAKQAYAKTQNEVKSYCKNYYTQSVFAVPNNALRTAQALLDAETTLLDYVITPKKIYIFVIQNDKANWFTYDKDFPLEQSVTDFILSISTSQKDEFAYVQKAKKYADLATLLYAKLIAPIAAELKQNVIIVPDKALANLPFDALLTKVSEKTERFQQHQYLLQKYNISYCNSIDLLSKMKIKNSESRAKNTLLAVAPFYDNSSPFIDSLKSIAAVTRDKLDALPYSGEEVFKVAKIMGGKTLTGNDANKNNVTDVWTNYQILHFATHGKANFEQGEFSYLAFSPMAQDKRLYAKDIYNFDLNHVEMVVLSACESGIGEQQIGEGAISIARAFAQAGAKSIVTTLWSINDEKTKDIMAYFYKNLKAGMTKSKALQQAKITYLLSQKGNNAHPFFWAAFELIGNPASVMSDE